ncbi:MAG: VWA domain-containing protein, partial [Planctomycetota bacterium]
AFGAQASTRDRVCEALAVLALDAPERGARLLAVDELAQIGIEAAPFLELVVDHGDDPEVRARALGVHATLDPDQGWYVALLTGVDRKLRSDRLDRDVSLVGAPLRRAAFDVVATALDEEALTGLLEASDVELRVDALDELARREVEGIEALTLERYQSRSLPKRERLLAGALHARYAEVDYLKALMAAAAEDEVDQLTRKAVGRAVAPRLTIRLTGDLQRTVDDGNLGERTVAASALRGDRSTKFRKNLVRLLDDEDPGLRRLAVEELAAWPGEQEVLEALLEDLEEGPELGEGGGLVRSATVVAEGAPDWDEQLRAFLEHPSASARSAALRLLHERTDPAGRVALLAPALRSDDWPRVGAAVELLIAERTPEAVEALIDALGELEGRDQRAVSDGLWRISGLQLGLRAKSWQAWWDDVREGFEPLSPEETELLLEERRREAEEGGTSASFFGVELESRRVCFIVDTSGSMDELTSWGRTDRDDGGVARDTRLDVAKAELAAALDALPPGTLFNVVVFSNDADVWEGRLQPANPSTVRKAKAFVDRQKAKGGTNLYAALRVAFEDQGLDSLVLLSDGEPSMGKLRDPEAILGAIERWNGGRGVRIDCIAIGIQLEMLERLAESCFGSCLTLR